MIHRVRSLGMVAAFLVGGIFHAEFSRLQWWLPIGIAFMLTITFIGIDTAKLKPRMMHLWVLLGIEVIGLGFFALARAAGYPVLAESLYYCGAAPIAAACPIIINIMRGNVEFTTTAMVLSHAVYALFTPFILPLVLPEAHMGYGELVAMVAGQLASVLAAPAVLSVLMRVVYPPCRFWAPKLKDVSLFFWIGNLTIVSACGVDRIVARGYGFWEMFPMALGALAICAAGFLSGYRLGYPRLKRECSQCLGQKNTVLTLYMAGQDYATPLAYIGPVFYVFCHNMANALQIALSQREQETDPQIPNPKS